MPNNQHLNVKKQQLTKGTNGKLYLSIRAESPSGLNWPCLEFDPAPETLVLLGSMGGKVYLLKELHLSE